MTPTDPIRGLTAAEAAARAARGLGNRPPRSDRAEYRAIAARNLFTLFNALVVPAAVALFLLGDYRGAWAVSAMAVTNTLIGLVQEVRAKRHLDRLALLAETKARVVRDGDEHLILAGDAVLGDLIRLAAGEPVVADGTVLAAQFLEVDEALLTGESDPVPRRPGDALLSGSFAAAGDGAYRADKVGGQAFAHQTSAAARQYRYTPGPVQRTLDKLIQVLTAITLVLCGLYLLLYFARPLPTTDLVRMVAATVTSMVPQGLVLMTTLALTLGAVRLSHRGAVVQRLSAVEAMASVDVVCMDKTGTLTTSNLTVDRVDAIDGDETGVREKLRLFAWASIDEGNRSVQALRQHLGKPAGEFTRIDQIPFKSQNRYSAVRVRAEGGDHVLVMGSLDALRPRFTDAEGERIEARFRELLPTGLRLLALAEGESNPSPQPPPRGGEGGPNQSPLPEAGRGLGEGLLSSSLRPLALVALSDEIRPEAGGVLEALAAQGIRFKILSGDHPETVRATVAHLKLPLAREPVHTGSELEAAADRDRVIADGAVFGRVAPKQKLEIVTALQRHGRRAAMIGDGVNDILSIKTADLGIAMGAGSSATKTVAGLVLENNSFDLLPAALAEGRTVLHNVRRAAKLFLLKNVYTLLLIVVLVGLLGAEFPYLPQQVTLLNALTIGGPALLIMLSKAPPGAAVRAAFLPEVGRFVIGMGLALGIAGLVVWQFGETVEGRRTLLLSTLVLAGLANVVRIGEGDRRLTAWAVLALPAYLAALYVPPVAYFFELVPPTAGQWAAVVGAAVAGFVCGWLAVRPPGEPGPPQAAR